MNARPQRFWLVLARAVCVLLAALIILLIAASIPFEYAYYKSVCASAACATDTLSERLTPAGVQALQAAGLSAEFYATYNVAVEVIAALVFAAVAAVIFWHRSDERMGLLAAFTLLTAGCAIFIASLLAARVPVLWLPAACVNFLGQASFGIFFYLFPDGRFVPRWTRWFAAGSSVWWAASIFAPNIPLSFNGTAFLGFLASLVAVQIYRYRRVSTATQRQQTRWVVYGFVVAMAGFVGTLVLSSLVPMPQRPNPFASMIGTGILTGFTLLIPLSISAAILRSRLWDIDILIRRTLVYSTLTLTLGLIYVGSIVLLQALVVPLTGGSDVAIVASTLVIAALFTPLRRRIQNLIDRRFYRRKYDAARVLAAFGATARDETNLAQLAEELARVVDETMQPEFVGVWLREQNVRREI